MKTRTLFYLAAPYNHPDPLVKRQRLKVVNRAASELIQKGQWVFSPLTHNALLDNYGIFGNWEVWGDYDLEMVKRCDGLFVLTLPGWEESKGVTLEINYAKELGKEIIYLDPPEEGPINPECSVFIEHLKTSEKILDNLKPLKKEEIAEAFTKLLHHADELGIDLLDAAYANLKT